MTQINQTFDTFALTMIEFLSIWCKSRIKRHRKKKKHRYINIYRSKIRRHKNIPSAGRGYFSLYFSPPKQQQSTAAPTCYTTCHCQEIETTTTASIFVQFNLKQFQVGIDNRATVCISNHTNDFIGKLIPILVTLTTYNEIKTVELITGTL